MKLFSLSRYITRWHSNWINPFATLYFNIHYLPFRQAVRMPIWIYGHPCFLGLKGNVEVVCDNLTSGMIQLNATKHTPYPSIPFEWVNDGGTVTFHGPCSFDNGARFHIFGDGHLSVGAGVRATGVTLGCQESIELQDNVWIGNGSIIYDTDFHFFLDRSSQSIGRSFKPVVIEHDVSIFTQCYIAKGVRIPHHCIVSSRSTLLVKPYKCQPYSLIGGNPGEVLATDFEHLRLSGDEERQLSEQFKQGIKRIDYTAEQ